jgi:hypothetical protein
MKRETWTIEPDDDVKSIVSKEIIRIAGKKKENQRGIRTRIVNESIRKTFSSLTANRGR